MAEPEPLARRSTWEHFLPEEIELLAEFYRNRRTVPFAATMLNCSERNVTKWYSKFRRQGLGQDEAEAEPGAEFFVEAPI